MKKESILSIGFYPRYDRLGASSRYRFFDYFDAWQKQLSAADEPSGKRRRSWCNWNFCAACPAAGHCRAAEEADDEQDGRRAAQENCPAKLAIHPGLSNAYLRNLYRGKSLLSRCGQLAFWLRRFRECYTLEDNLLIEYELLPGISARWERRQLEGRRYILNFDDNVWEKYRSRPALSGKYDALIEGASGVIVANDFLYRKVRPLNAHVTLIPTVVKLSEYQQQQWEKFERFTVVWIGTPVTYRYLKAFEPILQKMSEAVDFELLILADSALASTPLSGVNAHYVNWSQDTEVEYLRRSHVGIMPLTDDDFSLGKSAFKLIQYQAAGLPSIASAVGENCHVVENWKNGFLCEAEADDWIEALSRMAHDEELYRKMQQEALHRSFDYSFEKYFPLFQDFVLECFAAPRKKGC